MGVCSGTQQDVAGLFLFLLLRTSVPFLHSVSRLRCGKQDTVSQLPSFLHHCCNQHIIGHIFVQVYIYPHIYTKAELQKRADRADQLVLFFLAGANFWEKHAKNRRKQAKNRRLFGANFFGGKIGRC